jgi:hypothetical protein
VQIDDGVGVILPDEVVERLRLSPGGTVFVRELDGCLQLTTCEVQEDDAHGTAHIR